MRLYYRYRITGTARCAEQSIRVHVIGQRDRLSEGLRRAIEQSEHLSAAGSRLHLRIVVAGYADRLHSRRELTGATHTNALPLML